MRWSNGFNDCRVSGNESKAERTPRGPVARAATEFGARSS